jgi:hypothetical protein
VDDPVPASSRPWIDAENLHVERLGTAPDVPSCQGPDQRQVDSRSGKVKTRYAVGKKESGEPCATTAEAPNGGSDAKTTTLTLLPGNAAAGTKVTLSIGFEEPGGQLYFTYQAGAATTTTTTQPQPASATGVTITSLKGTGGVEVLRGGVREQAGPGFELKKADVISTDVDAEVVLHFPDGSAMELREMTQVHVDDLLTKGVASQSRSS